MRTTRSTDGGSARPGALRLSIACLAVALVASCAVTAAVVRPIPPSAVVGHEPVCGTTETDTSDVDTDALGVGCDDDRRAIYLRTGAWPRKRAGSDAPSGEVLVKPCPDRAATWTAIALAESGGSTGT